MSITRDHKAITSCGHPPSAYLAPAILAPIFAVWLTKTLPWSCELQRDGKFQASKQHSLQVPFISPALGGSQALLSHHQLIFHLGETLGNKEHEAGLEGPKVGGQWRLMRLINKNKCTFDENTLGLLQNSWEAIHRQACYLRLPGI